MTNGYNFYFKDGEDVLTFPITPGELTIKVGSNNKVVTLISEGDVNILKSPSLIEVSFEARFPMRKYPYSREVSSFETYFKKFEELKEKRKSFRFIVARTTPSGKRTWDTNILMALEDFELKESADEGDDVIITFNLKQYKKIEVKKVKLPKKEPEKTEDSKPSTSTSEQSRDDDNRTASPKSYKVKSGDCLWNIAKKFYGDGSKWRTIYNANKGTIESTAKRYGKASSQDGHWIYPGTWLTIPALTSKSSKPSSTTATSTSKSPAKPSMLTALESTANKSTTGGGSSGTKPNFLPNMPTGGGGTANSGAGTGGSFLPKISTNGGGTANAGAGTGGSFLPKISGGSSNPGSGTGGSFLPPLPSYELRPDTKD